MAATNKRVTFLISVSPRSLELLFAGETLRRFYENGTHVRKARDFALVKIRMLRPELVRGLTSWRGAPSPSVNRRSMVRLPYSVEGAFAAARQRLGVYNGCEALP